MMEFLWFSKQKLSNGLRIYVKSNIGNTLSIELNPEWDIKNVKQIVAPKLGLEPDEVKIIFAGKELGDSIIVSECDLGQQSILHAIKISKKPSEHDSKESTIEEIEEHGSEPLCKTLKDSDFCSGQSESSDLTDQVSQKIHFFVYCSTCKGLKKGKLRVRCHFCKCGAFTVHSDPQNWDDVLERKKITGLCENNDALCAKLLNNAEPNFAEFYFKCAEHVSLGEDDEAVPLYLIRSNLREVSCLACSSVSDPVFVFPCEESHVACLDCFRQYCIVKLHERQFIQHEDYGYTLACPIKCPNSYIKEVHHFHLFSESDYLQYQRFAAEEFVLKSGGVLCPQPGCGMGILAEPDCLKITCINGCGYVFCRRCLQGYHIGDCDKTTEISNSNSNTSYNIDPAKAAESRWDEASKLAIKVLTKPCPKCRTPTERDGGCMHMVCTRSGCNYEWCWICQINWTRECMGNHWFG